MKRSDFVKLAFPIGSIIRFVGDQWLSSLVNALGIIVSHNDAGYHDEAFQVLVNGRIIDILCDEFEDCELELLEQQ